MEKSEILNRFSTIQDQLYCIIFSGSYFYRPKIDNWKDVDITVVVKELSFELQKNISEIAKQLKADPGFDISLDCITEKQARNPRNILNLHTKVANAIYEANINPSRVMYLESEQDLYKLTEDDVRIYSKTALRELFLEAHKDISRNLVTMIETQDPKIIKRYIKRIFNIIKMAIIYKTGKVPQSKDETLLLAKDFFKYDFKKTESFKEIIINWPNLKNRNYTKLLNEIINEIYSFYEYLLKEDNIL